MKNLDSLNKLDHVILLCNNLEDTYKFYEQVLGLKSGINLEDWKEFDVGDTALTLRRRKRNYDGVADSKAPGVQLAFKVDSRNELDDWYQKLKTGGVDIIESPKDQEWKHRTVFFNDPEGNIIEIYCEL